MLDLFAGLGGASQAMRARGWDVVTVDNDPRFGCTHTADLSTWGYEGPPVDLVWASPPCTEFSRVSMPWCRRPKWQRCGCCENFWCNVHRRHAHECKCPPVEEWASSPYAGCPEPSMGLVLAAKRIIEAVNPRWWVVENVRGASKYLTPLFGKPRVYGPFFLWGDFPAFECKVVPFKERLSSSRRAERAKVPESLSAALAAACESSLF